MANHGVLIPEAIMATNIDSLNRHVVDVLDVDNGFVFTVGTKPSTTGSMAEVWDISAPTSEAGLWMAYESTEIPMTDSRYKGIDPDPRHFWNASGMVFSAYKPQIADLILVSADALRGTYSAGVTTHVTPSTGSWALNWANAASASGLCYKLTGVKYISLATGAIDDQRETAYEFECVNI